MVLKYLLNMQNCMLNNRVNMINSYKIRQQHFLVHSDIMSRVMRKLACICENKDTDQLRSNREADQRLCFHYMDSTITLLPKFMRNFKPLVIFCVCTARFVSGLVGKPKDWFSLNEAHMINYAIKKAGVMRQCTDTNDRENQQKSMKTFE